MSGYAASTSGTHIQTRELLTPQQIARYDRLRGYANGRGEAHSGRGAQHHDG